MKQTAVEWLVEQIKKDSNLRLRGFDIDGIGNQAKAMEKEQIIEAYRIANEEDIYYNPLKTAEQYYNETFKSE